MIKKLVDISQKFGVSVWLDNIDKNMLHNGHLAGLIDVGARGQTSNPSIFEKAIASGQYDDHIAGIKQKGASAEEIYWDIAMKDIRLAADMFRPVYDITGGHDGFVSLEVSPILANDTKGTIEQAVKLWGLLDRKNVMIKIPATDAGLKAIPEVIKRGINVNVTLIFGPTRYKQVLDAYIQGLKQCQNPESIQSVASVFISRVDSLVDEQLVKLDKQHLNGKAGITQALQCYYLQQSYNNSSDWSMLAAAGANKLRPLWASTSVKNPDYNPLMYVAGLLTPGSVNTVPDNTLQDVLSSDIDKWNSNFASQEDVDSTAEELETAGVSLEEVYSELEAQGVSKFVDAFDSLLDTIKKVD